MFTLNMDAFNALGVDNTKVYHIIDFIVLNIQRSYLVILQVTYLGLTRLYIRSILPILTIGQE